MNQLNAKSVSEIGSKFKAKSGCENYHLPDVGNMIGGEVKNGTLMREK
jgi:hypothetical protein